MEKVDCFIDSVMTFYRELQTDSNGRYRSWEHCYKCFHDARHSTNLDYDYLSLQLAFYLASWGMYRGSSFLLQKDYKVHVPVVEEILDKKYDCLFGLECRDLRKNEVWNRLCSLDENLKQYYDGVRRGIGEFADVKKGISDTLTTKILMGTLGCVPAYDRYFVDGVKDQKITSGMFTRNSLLRLVEFYEQNRKKLEEVRNNMNVYDLPYPQMKLLDMGFWQIGFEKEEGKGIKEAH